MKQFEVETVKLSDPIVDWEMVPFRLMTIQARVSLEGNLNEDKISEELTEVVKEVLNKKVEEQKDIGWYTVYEKSNMDA